MKRLIMGVAAILFASWVAVHFDRLTGDQDGLIRFVLGTVLSVLILFRLRPVIEAAPRIPGWIMPLLVGAGTLFTVVGGIIFGTHQFEWLGIVLLVSGCLLWALPEGWVRNILPSMILLYWIHPLPGRVFGQFQLLMQSLSVKGSELLLHCFNVRIWADDFILNSGFQTFGVPDSCSGMRTAVTVLLCTFGVAMLFRLRWFETAAFLVLGVAQVLLINIARITAMVMFAPRMQKDWADHFLHDTLGIFLLVTILLVQGEMSWWKFFKERRRKHALGLARGHIERFADKKNLPQIWRTLLSGGLLAAVLAGVVGAIGFAAYKHRPSHRSAMIAGVAEALIETDPSKAASAIESALRLTPGNRELLSMRVNVMVRRGRYESALKEFSRRPGNLSVQDSVLKSWALMALKREEEAIAIVNGLSALDRELPGVAMVRAEYAARRERPEECAQYVVQAAPLHVLIRRVRSLFPYLAAHEQWRAIASCDSPVPFEDLDQALISIHANLQVEDLDAAGDLVQTVLQEWPDDPRSAAFCLGSLFTLATKRSGGPWEGLFARKLKSSIQKLSPDLLSAQIGYAFQLGRPDLAWLTYARLQALDATDPSLFMSRARFAGAWFMFRRQQVGVGASTAKEQINLEPFFMLSHETSPFRQFWEAVPHAADIARGNAASFRQASMQRCLEELEKRAAAGGTSLRMDLMYPTALAMLGRFDEAHERLDSIAKRFPEQRQDVLLQHALLYDQQGRWQDSYEALTKYRVKERMPLTAELVFINALMNLNLGSAAFEVARHAEEMFPGNPQIAVARAGIWDSFGAKEEALFELAKSGGKADSAITVQLLYDSGRLLEAEKVSQALGVKIKRRAESKQSLTPPLAEISVVRMDLPAITPEQIQKELGQIDAALGAASSPFLRGLLEQEKRWLQMQDAPLDAALAKCMEAGRNPLEQATILHRFVVHLARRQRYDDARQAIAKAVELTPRSNLLRRMLTSLSKGDRKVIEEARAECPLDPELWIASIVARARAEGTGSWMRAEMEMATAQDLYAPSAIVRAGDYMMRSGQYDAAELAARYGLARGRGYLPTYGLAIKCAVKKKDLRWALATCLAGIEQAADPTPFYKVIVEIKATDKSVDVELVHALEVLKDKQPENSVWGERLGQAYFQLGEPQRALALLGPLIHEGGSSLHVQSMLMAAEAARLEGVLVRGVEILEAAHAMYGDRVKILNNLVYYLAQNPATLPRARELLPELLEKGKDSFVVLDTAAMVFLRSGQVQESRSYMDKALALLRSDDYAAMEVRLNSAEVAFRAGDLKRARKEALEVRKDKNLSKMLDLRARKMLDSITEAESSR
jgi:exosortase/archaeosortase family protein